MTNKTTQPKFSFDDKVATKKPMTLPDIVKIEKGETPRGNFLYTFSNGESYFEDDLCDPKAENDTQNKECTCKTSSQKSQNGLKLYIWEATAEGYCDGMACAIAYTFEEALGLAQEKGLEDKYTYTYLKYTVIDFSDSEIKPQAWEHSHEG